MCTPPPKEFCNSSLKEAPIIIVWGIFESSIKNKAQFWCQNEKYTFSLTKFSFWNIFSNWFCPLLNLVRVRKKMALHDDVELGTKPTTPLHIHILKRLSVYVFFSRDLPTRQFCESFFLLNLDLKGELKTYISCPGLALKVNGGAFFCLSSPRAIIE